MSPFIRFLLVPAPCQSIICRNRQSSRNREQHAISVEFKSSGFVMDEATAKLIAEKGVWLSLDRLLWFGLGLLLAPLLLSTNLFQRCLRHLKTPRSIQCSGKCDRRMVDVRLDTLPQDSPCRRSALALPLAGGKRNPHTRSSSRIWLLWNGVVTKSARMLFFASLEEVQRFPVSSRFFWQSSDRA